MRAILVPLVIVGATASAAAEAPELLPAPWVMPDLAGPPKAGIDAQLAVTDVEETIRTPASIEFRNRRTKILALRAFVESRLSTRWVVGADVPYLTSDHPRSSSGPGNTSISARWAKTTRGEGRKDTFGVGFVLRIPTAGSYDRVVDPIPDADIASDTWTTEYTRFRSDTGAIGAHVDVRAGGRRFVQAQASLEFASGEYNGADIVPRISIGAGGYVWDRLAVVADAAVVLVPDGGIDGHGPPTPFNVQGGVRYIEERFIAGLRISGHRTGAGGGADFAYLF